MSHTSTAELPRSVAVVGLGLIGASLCAALRATAPDVRLIGIARRAEIASRAVEDGICDVAGSEPSLLGDVEVVVLCTPVDAMPHWLAACRESAPAALVTDSGSTKAWVVDQAAAILPRGRFLGGHPMAGRERSGYDAAEATLFNGCTWVMTPCRDDDLAAFAPWCACVERVGAHIEVLDPASHDLATAWISHLPFALSAALVRAASGDASWAAAQWLAASGFRDMARLSGGDPAMYAAITSTNAAAINAALSSVETELRHLRAAISGGETAAANAYFDKARSIRRRWLAARAAAGRPLL